MRRFQRFLFIALISAAGWLIGGCGSPQEERSSGGARARATSAPVATRPATGAWGRSFDAETNFPDFNLTLVGASWVQLDHLQRENTTIVIGLEPTMSGNDIERMVDEHRQEFNNPPTTRHRGSGTIESDVLGSVMWSWGTTDNEDTAMTQLALFGTHPSDNSLLMARFEYPSASDDIQAELEELVLATEIIGPGL